MTKGKTKSSVTYPGYLTLNEPPHDKTKRMTCAPSEDSDQLGRPLSLIRDQSLGCPHEESLGP